MSQTLASSLKLFGHEPRIASAQQIWRGGETDRATRRMRAAPARWLALREHASATEAPDAEAGPVPLLAWELEQLLPGDRPAPSRAGGVVLVSMDCAPEVEEEFNDWYNTEHIPLLSRVPGMIAARRFCARQGHPAYVALYHVENTDIYASPQWCAANETPWILRLRRFQHNRTYFMFRERVR